MRPGLIRAALPAQTKSVATADFMQIVTLQTGEDVCCSRIDWSQKAVGVWAGYQPLNNTTPRSTLAH